MNRFIEGQGSNRYRSADYDKLQAIAQLRKAAGKETIQKVEKITKASKEKKEQSLLQQHKACWSKEKIRLHSLQRKLQSEIEALRPGSPLDYSSIKEFFKDLETYEEILSEDTRKFKENTIQPLWDLREDLQFWVGENRDRILMGESTGLRNTGMFIIMYILSNHCRRVTVCKPESSIRAFNKICSRHTCMPAVPQSK